MVSSLSCFSHHFPYFKTAPAGWKNSVRHNLSLNKCFEKIEKPHSSGSSGSQRKGCLWAMNPAKITKMDDEVAKWSRKDPSAIKKAMVCPGTVNLQLQSCNLFDILLLYFKHVFYFFLLKKYVQPNYLYINCWQIVY